MKIFSAAQIKACDAYTIHAKNIASHDLMEQAGSSCVDWISRNYRQDVPFIILCGPGNNGGDGLVIARMLIKLGYGVKVFLLQFSELTKDCRLNLKRLQDQSNGSINLLNPGAFISDIPPNIVMIDAILGTGLNRPVEDWLADFINYINDLPNEKIAIDMPSGLPADNIPAAETPVISATHTLSFQFYKRAFLHRETGHYAGKVHILNIGLHKTYISSTHTNYHSIDHETIATMYRPRKEFSHKGTYGTTLIIGGSYGMIGAIALSAKAALRTGAGKVKVLLPECGYNIIQTLVPEAMCETNGERFVQEIGDRADVQSIGIGPGMGQSAITARAFAKFIDAHKTPIVVDADGLNLLAKQPQLLHKLPPESILTPHPGEFERLFGKSPDSMLQLENARTQAMRYNIYMVLKGRYSVVITPEGECYYNLTGNAGMATGGAGDVLTGILAGLLSQGYEPYEATMMGVYLHALAGDITAKEKGQEAMIAGDITEHIGDAYKTLQQESPSY